MKKTYKFGSLVVAVALLGFSLSGCAASNKKAGDDMGGMDHGSSHSMTITDKQSFAEAMIPHHQQAIDMSAYAQTNTSNGDILAIAAKITAEQGPEIDTMTPWLEGKSVNYMMMMDGMLSPVQLTALRTSKDGDFDKLYVQYMIEHHEGAVQMASDALAISDPELSEFANAIIVAQTAEIAELLALLKN
jgi:uncharacterized protein (DUF305 family)